MLKRISNTHVRNKSEFELMVDNLLQFDKTKTIQVQAIPLLITEGIVEFADFIYNFYRLFQFKFGNVPVENDIDDRLEVSGGICYTLDCNTVSQEPIVAANKTIFIKHCNAFLDDWINKLIYYAKSNPTLGYADSFDYWAMKVRLKSGQVGWIYPKELLIPIEDGKYQALFYFKPVP